MNAPLGGIHVHIRRAKALRYVMSPLQGRWVRNVIHFRRGESLRCVIKPRWGYPIPNTMLKHRGCLPRGWGRGAPKERGWDGMSVSEWGNFGDTHIRRAEALRWVILPLQGIIVVLVPFGEVAEAFTERDFGGEGVVALQGGGIGIGGGDITGLHGD